MGEMRNGYMNFGIKSEGKIFFGNLRGRLNDNIIEDLKLITVAARSKA
jgi:hypothetical protein